MTTKIKLMLLGIAPAALVATSLAAQAADLPVSAPVYKAAPPPVAAYSWTGCYVGAGLGYGMYNIDHDGRSNTTNVLTTLSSTSGGKGWLATAGVGCDYQIGERWLLGAFVDGDLSNIKGDFGDRVVGSGDMLVGSLKQRSAWAVGARIGYLVTPALLTYADGGFTRANFNSVDYVISTGTPGAPSGIQLPATTFNGYFLGGGTEYAFGWLPGLFWKNEYRLAQYRGADAVLMSTSLALSGVPAGTPYGIPIG